ncbi:hypothetical protein LCGC14_2177740 [marine sediment metagenome]|uniref:Uncharacterized protein n=1 Tax=marine sediment metagenome TaxID=412755 RepID=A0A0F9GJ07_9ZZZZ
MGDWPIWGGGQTFDRVDIDGANPSFCINVPSSATQHTKGAWVELVASSPISCDGFLFTPQASSTGFDYLYDIGVGAVDSEEIILANIQVMNQPNAPVGTMYIPLSIPSGTRIAGRVQSTSDGVAKGVRAGIQLVSQDFPSRPGLWRSETHGAATADTGGTGIDPGGTVNTEGAWVQLVASTANATRAMSFALGGQENTARSDIALLLDIGIGAGGSEQVFVKDYPLRFLAATDLVLPPFAGAFPCHIPSGTRIAARAKASSIDATDRLFDIIVYTFG